MKFQTFAKVLFFVILCSCSTGINSQESGTETLEPICVSSIEMTGSGKPFLLADGEPFAIYGAQIRIDIFRSVDKLSWSEIENYFATAANFGVNTVQVPMPWAFLEPKQDQWSFSEIDQILSLANKYDLKVELLWFSTNMIGDAYSWLVPTYILATPSVRLNRKDDAAWHGLYGYTYSLLLNDPWILERETKAVTVLFNHIRKWDEENGNRHPVITCQVHNEPDALVRWRLNEKEIAYRDGTRISAPQAWQMTLDALNTVGLAIKNSSYRVATRTNIISGDGVNSFPQTPGISPKDVFALDGIDFVSFDPYMETVNQIAYEVSQYASLPGNYPLVAENRGDYSNTASLMLAASALGGGYDIYDLATSKYITANSKPPFNTEGIFESDLSPKNHTALVSTLLSGLTKLSKEIATVSTENFAVFNILTDSPRTVLTQNIRTTSADLTFKTDKGALAFVLDLGNEIVAYSTESATLEVRNGSLTENESGRISLEKGKIYRFGFKSDGPLTSTVKKNIGTLLN